MEKSTHREREKSEKKTETEIKSKKGEKISLRERSNNRISFYYLIEKENEI